MSCFMKGEKMKKNNEQGRTMVEIISVLAIMGLLSIGGVMAYMNAVRNQKVDELLNALRMKTVEINSAMENKKFVTEEETNKFLAKFDTTVGGYTLSFHASPDKDGFVSDITNSNGEPIKGKICRTLILKMADQSFVSDVDFLNSIVSVS